MKIIDEQEEGEKHGVDAAAIVEGELGKNDPEVANFLKTLDPSAWDGKGVAPPRELTDAEKAEKKGG